MTRYRSIHIHVLLSIFFIPSTSLQSFAISRLPRNSDKILRIPVRFIGYSIRLDFLSPRPFFENNIFLVVVVVSSSSSSRRRDVPSD